MKEAQRLAGALCVKMLPPGFTEEYRGKRLGSRRKTEVAKL